MEEPKPGGKLRQSRIALVIGTRPEAIKLSPVAHALAALGERPRLLVTGQHPGLELADHRLAEFDATPLHCAGQPDPMVHAELVRGALKRLLPMAQQGLAEWDVDTAVSDRLLGAIERRCTAYRNGAEWQVETVHRIEEQKPSLDRRGALREMLRRYSEHMHANLPVADWPQE
jgi:hypothetical protein